MSKKIENENGNWVFGWYILGVCIFGVLLGFVISPWLPDSLTNQNIKAYKENSVNFEVPQELNMSTYDIDGRSYLIISDSNNIEMRCLTLDSVELEMYKLIIEFQ